MFAGLAEANTKASTSSAMISRMDVAVELTSELKSWITHNLDRGCAPEQLVGSMIGQHFEPGIAEAVIGAFVRARAGGASIPDGKLCLQVDAEDRVTDPPRLPAGNVIRTSDRSIPVLLRMRRPIVALLSNVLSDQECDQLIALARPRLTPSTVVDPESGENRIVQHRNSEGMFFRLRETEFIARLDRRLSELMNSPIEHGEGLQVLRYGPGNRSAPHVDFLIPSNIANEQSLARSGQRVSSLVVYLNDVPGGGETEFPEVGISVLPRRGHATYFEYCDTRNQLDPLTLHAGAPVIEGEKWAMTKWIRQRPFRPA